MNNPEDLQDRDKDPMDDKNYKLIKLRYMAKLNMPKNLEIIARTNRSTPIDIPVNITISNDSDEEDEILSPTIGMDKYDKIGKSIEKHISKSKNSPSNLMFNLSI